MDKAFLRSDSINGRSGGETPPALAGEDACATIESARIFDLVYRTFKTGGSGTRVMIALVVLAAELGRAQIGAGTNEGVATGTTATNAITMTPGAAASSLSGYVPDDKYKLRAGDRVAFQIVEDRDAPKSLVVADSGELDLPYIGRAAAVEKTCKQLAGELKGQLEKEYYYRATVVIALEAANKFF